MDRWPTFHKPALRWTERVERTIVARDHPDGGACAAILNAIEYQFEHGADPETVRLLLVALAHYTSSCGISPAAIGLDSDPAATLAKLVPSASSTR